MRLRAQHVRVLRIQLLDTRRDILPERRPEKDVIILTGGRRLTPDRNETGLRWSAHRRRPADLEEVLHVHGWLPRVSRIRFIFVQPLQTIEILPAQQSVQVRRLLGTEETRLVVYNHYNLTFQLTIFLNNSNLSYYISIFHLHYLIISFLSKCSVTCYTM